MASNNVDKLLVASQLSAKSESSDNCSGVVVIKDEDCDSLDEYSPERCDVDAVGDINEEVYGAGGDRSAGGESDQDEDEWDMVDPSGIVEVGLDEDSSADSGQEEELNNNSTFKSPAAASSASSLTINTSDLTCGVCSYTAPSSEARFVHEVVHREIGGGGDQSSRASSSSSCSAGEGAEDASFHACPHGCGWVPGARWLWQKHMSDVHSPRAAAPTSQLPTKNDGEEESAFACSQCPFNHRFLGVVRVHEDMVHGNLNM